MEPLGSSVSFIVRVSLDDTERLAGIVERVRTGQRQRFVQASAIGSIIERLARSAQPAEPRGPETTGDEEDCR
jgi:hypothetical protein